MGAGSSRDRALPRDRLIEGATELFAAHGYQAIGLRDLAAHVGLQPGSLYHHFESKQQLLFEIIESALSDLLAATRQRLRQPTGRLHAFVQAFVTFSLQERNRLLLVEREFINLSEEQQHEAGQLKDDYSTQLAAIIGERDPLVTQAIIGMLFGQLHWHIAPPPEQELTQALVDFAHAMAGACKKPTNR